MAYYRRADRNLLILANLKSEPEKIDINCEHKVLLDNMGPIDKHTDKTQEQTQGCIQLQAWQGVVLELI
jgi:hypothetical protein